MYSPTQPKKQLILLVLGTHAGVNGGVLSYIRDNGENVLKKIHSLLPLVVHFSKCGRGLPKVNKQTECFCLAK